MAIYYLINNHKYLQMNCGMAIKIIIRYIIYIATYYENR